MGIAIVRLDGPTAGQVYIERDDLAEAMISTGQAERATFGEHNVSAPAAPETPESSKPVGKMSRIIEDQDSFYVVRVIERTDAHHIPFRDAQVETNSRSRAQQPAISAWSIQNPTARPAR